MPQLINKLIKLDKPLVIFDLETTGLAISIDKIIEIAYLKVMPNGVIFKGNIFLNPEMEIPQEAVAIHGITNEFLADKPTFKEKAQEIWETFNGCHYGGYNILNFDLLILRREFIRVGMDFDYSKAKIIDAKAIFHYMEPRTLSAAYKFYSDKELKDSHSALADVEATAEIISKQLSPS
jgi:DNA polymerase-3 subunit epsilon